jgi:hypothetical protein
MQKHGTWAIEKSEIRLICKPSTFFDFLVWISSAGYIGEFEEIDDHRSGKIVIQLNGRLNKCGVISPRFNVALDDLETWVNNLLPSRQFGYLGKFAGRRCWQLKMKASAKTQQLMCFTYIVAGFVQCWQQVLASWTTMRRDANIRVGRFSGSSTEI